MAVVAMAGKGKRGRPNKILTHGKDAEVRRLAAQGKSAREIAAALTKRGFRIGHASVTRFLAEDTAERRATARNVMAREAKESIPLATKALNGFVVVAMQAVNDIRRVSTTAAENGEPTDPAMLRAMGDLLRAGTQAATSLAKITLGEESGDSAAAQALGDRIAGIIAARNKRGE